MPVLFTVDTQHIVPIRPVTSPTGVLSYHSVPSQWRQAKCLARSYPKQLTHKTVGLSGVLCLWIFGRPYILGGCLPDAELPVSSIVNIPNSVERQ